MKTWTTSIPITEIKIWCKLIWNCINICKYEPQTRPHVYVHGLSLLASILQFLDLSNHKQHGNIWDHVIKDIDSNIKEIINEVQAIKHRNLMVFNHLPSEIYYAILQVLLRNNL